MMSRNAFARCLTLAIACAASQVVAADWEPSFETIASIAQSAPDWTKTGSQAQSAAALAQSMTPSLAQCTRSVSATRDEKVKWLAANPALIEHFFVERIRVIRGLNNKPVVVSIASIAGKPVEVTQCSIYRRAFIDASTAWTTEEQGYTTREAKLADEDTEISGGARDLDTPFLGYWIRENLNQSSTIENRLSALYPSAEKFPELFDQQIFYSCAGSERGSSDDWSIHCRPMGRNLRNAPAVRDAIGNYIHDVPHHSEGQDRSWGVDYLGTLEDESGRESRVIGRVWANTFQNWPEYNQPAYGGPKRSEASPGLMPLSIDIRANSKGMWETALSQAKRPIRPSAITSPEFKIKLGVSALAAIGATGFMAPTLNNVELSLIILKGMGSQ